MEENIGDFRDIGVDNSGIFEEVRIEVLVVTFEDKLGQSADHKILINLTQKNNNELTEFRRENNQVVSVSNYSNVSISSKKKEKQI